MLHDFTRKCLPPYCNVLKGTEHHQVVCRWTPSFLYSNWYHLSLSEKASLDFSITALGFLLRSLSSSDNNFIPNQPPKETLLMLLSLPMRTSSFLPSLFASSSCCCFCCHHHWYHSLQCLQQCYCQQHLWDHHCSQSHKCYFQQSSLHFWLWHCCCCCCSHHPLLIPTQQKGGALLLLYPHGCVLSNLNGSAGSSDPRCGLMI